MGRRSACRLRRSRCIRRRRLDRHARGAGSRGSQPVASSRPRRRRSAKQHPLDRFDEISATAAAGKFPKGIEVFLAEVPRAVLCRAGTECIHVPAPHSGRHSEGAHQIAWHRCDFADDLAGGYADISPHGPICSPRDQSRRRAPEILLRLFRDWADFPRCRRRQYPQHHRQPHRRHRPAGADRYAAVLPRLASPHPVSSRTVRIATQVQHRVGWRRHESRCWKIPTTSRYPQCMERAWGSRLACSSNLVLAALRATTISRGPPAFVLPQDACESPPRWCAFHRAW